MLVIQLKTGEQIAYDVFTDEWSASESTAATSSAIAQARAMTEEFRNDGGFGPAYGEPGYYVVSEIAKGLGGKAILPPVQHDERPGIVY